MKRTLTLLAVVAGTLVVVGLVTLLVLPREKLISYLSPTINNMRITDARIGEERATMNVLVDVSPKLVDVFIDSISYDMRLYGTSVAKGSKGFDKSSVKGNKQTLKIPMTMNHNTTRELVRRQVAEDAPVQAHIKAFAEVPLFGRQEFDINQELDMVVPALPGMEVTGISIEDFGLDSMQMIMTVRLDNPNEFDFYIKEMKMNLQLAEHMTTVGNRSKDKLVKARSKTEMTIPAISDLKKPLKATFKLMKGNAEWPYVMKTYMVLEPASDVVGQVEINSTKTGTVNITRQIKKLKEEKKAEKESREN